MSLICLVPFSVLPAIKLTLATTLGHMYLHASTIPHPKGDEEG